MQQNLSLIHIYHGIPIIGTCRGMQYVNVLFGGKLAYHPDPVSYTHLIQKTYYNGSFPVEKYEGFAGVMQQYMFYYERKMATDHSKKARKQSEK